MTERPALEERPFLARDIRDLAGLTARQLNDWDKRGVLQLDRGSESEWRKFTAREVFAIMACAQLRNRFGVGLEKLAFVSKHMVLGKPDPLKQTLEYTADLGVPVWLGTDLESEVVVFPETVFEGPSEAVWFLHSQPGFLLLRIDPLAQKLVAHTGDRRQIHLHGAALADMRAAYRTLTAHSLTELQILELIRTGDFDSIEIMMTNGQVRTIRTNESLRDIERLDIEKVLQQNDYQTVKVTRRDGRNATIHRTVVIKPEASMNALNESGKTPIA